MTTQVVFVAACEVCGCDAVWTSRMLGEDGYPLTYASSRAGSSSVCVVCDPKEEAA